MSNTSVLDAEDTRRQSLYFPEAIIDQIRAEAERQDRSKSWIIKQAWRIARGQLHAAPDSTAQMGAEKTHR